MDQVKWEISSEMAVIKINLLIESTLSKDRLLEKIKNVGKSPIKRPTLLFDERNYDVTFNEKLFSIKQKPFYETLNKRSSMNEVSGRIDPYGDKTKIQLRIDFSNSLIVFNAIIVPLIAFIWMINPKIPTVLKILLPFVFFSASLIYIVSVKEYWKRFFMADRKATSKTSRAYARLKIITVLAFINLIISILLVVVSFFEGPSTAKLLSGIKVIIVFGILQISFLTGFLTYLWNALYLKMNWLNILKGSSLKTRTFLSILLLNGFYHILRDPYPIRLTGRAIIRKSQWRSLSSDLLFLSCVFVLSLFEYKKYLETAKDGIAHEARSQE